MIIHDSAIKHDKLLLLGALLCGCLHHMMFYEKAWGISYPLFMLVFYVYFYWAVKERCELRFDASLLMVLPIVLLSLTYTAFTNSLFAFLNALVIPVLIVIHTTWVMRKGAVHWYERGIIQAVLEQLFLHTLSYVPMPVKVAIRSLAGKINASRSQQIWKISAGIAISLPLLLLVVSLLASADTMFDRMLNKLPELLKQFEIIQFMFRTGWIVIVSIALFAYIYGLLHPKEIKQPMRVEDEWGRDSIKSANPDEYPLVANKPMRFDATITATILLIMNAVYVLFAVVQFSYFFAGGSALLPDGVTYAEYARRGFAELVVVTVINFTLLMVTLHGVDRSVPSMDRFLRVLLAMLIGCTAVMLCSAYFRLSMYEEAYGFTISRVLVHAFMIFLLLLFAIALIKVKKDHFQLMKPYLIAGMASYVLLNYIQVDGIIASSNIKRYETTGKIDTGYLGSLSFEVVPYLISLQSKHPEIEGAKEALQTIKDRLPHKLETSWLSFNVSEWRAAKALQKQTD
ncbi:DUF4153 domain-containing protein [Paenibacillus radicis (ex Xue et al. 2023)]|uniref:DUF4173 domain-containing protein n=1 Tax=Paenibacillus radicis (ex Xue et al. 2023) TaxID=2972489 RepID=A0ABT1YUC5_9BACL|nr:DUF4173 domain-containing protein [Paenibacillus radicis (ex Xue et al. 2023)]MCR8636702.1 DUF4173 domain-containing protein [Paenibacillus radicis (ex Xue et al. 2023)]